MSWHEVAAQVEEFNEGWRDEIATQRAADWADILDDRPGREECWTDERAPLRLAGPDPWDPWTCQRCGSVNTAGMPEKCDGCGLRNYGEGA